MSSRRDEASPGASPYSSAQPVRRCDGGPGCAASRPGTRLPRPQGSPRRAGRLPGQRSCCCRRREQQGLAGCAAGVGSSEHQHVSGTGHHPQSCAGGVVRAVHSSGCRAGQDWCRGRRRWCPRPAPADSAACGEACGVSGGPWTTCYSTGAGVGRPSERTPTCEETIVEVARLRSVLGWNWMNSW